MVEIQQTKKHLQKSNKTALEAMRLLAVLSWETLPPCI